MRRQLNHAAVLRLFLLEFHYSGVNCRVGKSNASAALKFFAFDHVYAGLGVEARGLKAKQTLLVQSRAVARAEGCRQTSWNCAHAQPCCDTPCR
jgi:hypothetical protein